MKVLLINPDTGHPERIESQAAWPPLGLLYIGSVLQNAGHEVKVIDNGRMQLSVEKIANRVRPEEPGIVGVSALTPTFKQGVKIARTIKAEMPDVKIVFGNYHATFTYDRILANYPFIDYVVLGEGELSFLELVNTLEKNKDIKKVLGIAYRHDGGVVKAPPRPLIQNLDDLPIPDRSLLEQEYHSEIMGMLGSGGKFTTVLTSRGCPYSCRYCACSAFSHRAVRFRSPEAVVAEMEQLYDDGYEDAGFVDDNLLLNRQRMEKICDMLKERKIRLNLWAEGRVDHASREVMKKFAGVGCKIIYFGMESGSQKVLDYYAKNITPEMSRKAVRNSKEAGIENVVGSFIVGAPIETEADVRQTFDFAMSLEGMDFPQMNPLCISPGMDLWETAVREGRLDEKEQWEEELIAVNVYPSRLTEEALLGMIGNFYSKFVMRPPFMFSQLLKTLSSNYRLRILVKNIKAGTNFRKTIRQFTRFYGKPKGT
jgi:anaerobic magnesium-protoporphyrin IX monomethyl ester cyclase